LVKISFKKDKFNTVGAVDLVEFRLGRRRRKRVAQRMAFFKCFHRQRDRKKNKLKLEQPISWAGVHSSRSNIFSDDLDHNSQWIFANYAFLVEKINVEI